MLRYGNFKDDYAKGRTPIDTGLLENILRESVKIVNGKEFENHDDYRKVITLLMSGISYYFFLHPEQYVDFGKFVAYRSADIKNLWTIESKETENAESIYEYYKQGGLQVEEIKTLVRNYALGLLEDSISRSNKLSNDITSIKNLIRHDEENSTNK